MSYLVVTENNTMFRQKVVIEMARQIDKVMVKIVRNIRTDVQATMSKLYRADKVYQGLTTGPLGGMLGLPAGQAANMADAIVAAVVNNMQFNYRPVVARGTKISGGLDIGVLQSDFRDILSLPQSAYSSGGSVIPWLEWLLLRGDQIIIAGYDVDFGNFDDSRSGIAIMIQDKSAAWRIPPEYSGIVNDNWLTRSIDMNIQLIEYVINKSVERHMKAGF